MGCPRDGWGGRWESNPQRPEPQSGALPVELLPPYLVIIAYRQRSVLELERAVEAHLARAGGAEISEKIFCPDSRRSASRAPRLRTRIPWRASGWNPEYSWCPRSADASEAA